MQSLLFTWSNPYTYHDETILILYMRRQSLHFTWWSSPSTLNDEAVLIIYMMRQSVYFTWWGNLKQVTRVDTDVLHLNTLTNGQIQTSTYHDKMHTHTCTHPPAGLGGSFGCAVRLETRRSWVQPPLRSVTFFRGDWSWNIFYRHSLPSAHSRRAVVSFWRRMCTILVNCLED